MPYLLTDLQACEPDELPRDGDVVVHLHDETDDMGFPSVDLESPTETALLDYVREHWGDEDPDWFREYVVGRVVSI